MNYYTKTCKRCGSELTAEARYCRRCGLYVGPGNTDAQREFIDCYTSGNTVFLTERQAAKGGHVRVRVGGTGAYADIRIEPGISSGTNKTVVREYTDRYGAPAREILHFQVIVEPEKKPAAASGYSYGAYSSVGTTPTTSESRAGSYSPETKKKARRRAPYLLLIIVAIICIGFSVPLINIIKSAFDTQTTGGQTPAPVTAAPVQSAPVAAPTVRPSAAPTVKTAEKPDVSAIPYFENRFYLKNLEESLLLDAVALYKGISSFEREIKLQNTMDEGDLGLLLNAIKYDCPELFQVAYEKQYTFWASGGRITSVSLPYFMTKNTYNSRLAQCQAVISQLKEDTEGSDADEREKYVYDYFTDTVAYSTTAEHCGNASGALLDGLAKCDGISLAMKWAMEATGIPALVLTGKDEGDPRGHAWNCVKIYGGYYDVDLTNDLIREENTMKLYSAYNVNRDWISRNYPLSDDIISYYKLPESKDISKSYHALNGSLIYSSSSIESTVYSQLDSALSGDGTGVIQFEDDINFNYFMYDYETYFDNWFYENGYWGSYSLTVLQEYRTVGFTLYLE